jgi:hypothetical protein
VQLGVAQVKLGEPGWRWEQLVASDFGDTLSHPRPGSVERVEEFGFVKAEGASDAERAFVERIDRQIAKGNNRELVLYVHGYRVYFDEVTVMMGSWAHYLGHGAVVTFQWPTGQYFWNYLTDCPRAERYIPDIERTIALPRARRRAISTSSPTAAARRCWERRLPGCATATPRKARRSSRSATASPTSSSPPPTWT